MVGCLCWVGVILDLVAGVWVWAFVNGCVVWLVCVGNVGLCFDLRDFVMVWYCDVLYDLFCFCGRLWVLCWCFVCIGGGLCVCIGVSGFGAVWLSVV